MARSSTKPRRKARPRKPRPFPTPGQWLAASRRRRRLILFAVVAALAGLVAADRNGWLLVPTDDRARYHGTTARVIAVLDGDTIEVDVPDGQYRTTRIRLWGVDTPEVGKIELGTPDEPGAAEAEAATRRWADGQDVTLELEPHSTRGHYGRLLAYVRLPEGDLLNERLLLEGLARADGRFAHHREQRFALLEEQARKRGLGLWARDPAD
ncbi:MAG: thermonuclease family protein [Planctomycetota bacterium]